MTNFENWQKSLPDEKRVEKPEDLIFDKRNDVEEDEDFRHVAMIECVECPCKNECDAKHDYWTGCADIFLEWAKEEV